jgi:hypothetical protein
VSGILESRAERKTGRAAELAPLSPNKIRLRVALENFIG